MSVESGGASPTDSRTPRRQTYLEGDLDALLEREWLLTNGLGGYASGTVAGCPTRRYHGLLVWSRRPPLQRYVTLAAVLERLTVDGQEYDLSTFEFAGAVHPQGFRYLKEFDYEIAPPEPWVKFVWEVAGCSVIKRLRLYDRQQACTITYEVYPPAEANCGIGVMPLIACRDFHALRRRPAVGPFEVQTMINAVHIRDKIDPEVTVCLAATGPMAWETKFNEHHDWWYNFMYRKEAERGMDCGEDLFTPGWFWLEGTGPLVLQITTIPGCEDVVVGVRRAWKVRAAEREAAWRVAGPPEVKALWRAAEQFLVERDWKNGKSTLTILAGYHWFGDWGRDTCIALPGLLLTTGRFEEAREVLETFAKAQKNGLIPNRFDDYGNGCDYNSADASLWFIRAVEMLAEASGDESVWSGKLGKAVREILEAFIAGTEYNIHAEEDGLLWCGDEETQLTWMDAKVAGKAVTPRYGKPVEINALWLHALQTAARHNAGNAGRLVSKWQEIANKGRERFEKTFWYEEGGYLYDVVTESGPDRRLRPNQVIALALRDCPLASERQKRALKVVEEKLLTPYGLRTLSPDEAEYRGRYEGNWQERDRAYHQGTVWPWLMGPFVEAYLKLHDFDSEACAKAHRWLEPLLSHMLNDAGLGSISEIFDGDPPHKPRGCIAQAWSVAEVLRALLLTQCRQPVSASYTEPVMQRATDHQDG